jgi:hypothetical protein
VFSNVDVLIGFAAIFAVFSLGVTALTQVARMALRMKNRYLIERLFRLFGELKAPARFVAAILAHPSLEGKRGACHYRALIDPGLPNGSSKVVDAIDKVLGQRRYRRLLGYPWPRTSDLDKQTVKDLGTTVYAQIGSLVDYALDEEDGAPATPPWAPGLKQALEGNASGPSAFRPFRGRIWALATAAFPEAEGHADPLKTYVAAFDDEAAATASDAFTLAARWTTFTAALLVALAFRLDAVQIWTALMNAQPERLQTFTAAAPAILNSTTISTDAKDGFVKGLTELARAPIPLYFFDKQLFPGSAPSAAPGKFDPLAWLPGGLLAVIALSFGAPFWFEFLRSAINLRSALSPKK